MKLRTDYWQKPIPSRSFDWTCVDDDTYDGAPDAGARAHITGYGATETEAIADWRQVWAEAHGAADWLEYVSAFETEEHDND